MMRNVELLAPAGGFNALCAAVQNGTDAVYLGEKSFSARKGAENFDDNDLSEAVKYAKIRGVKTYLALNTLIYDSEIEAFAQSVKKAADAGIDALIIADFGGAKIAKEVCPKMPIHASTQMSAHHEKDVEALLEAGFSRVVIARELQKEEILKIYEKTKAELEMFVHGALCVCASGQCLMSSFIGGRSGNRGECAQPCRREYFSEGKRGYFLSPKDLSLLELLGDIRDIGISSLKIEGRMKRAEYVANVTGMYRKYLDENIFVQKRDIDEMKKIFVRGSDFTKGYFAHINTPDILNMKSGNDNISDKADKEALKRAALSYREGAENVKIMLNARFKMKLGEAAELTFSDGVNTVSVLGDEPQTAINTPLTHDALKERISKLGGTPYVLSDFEAELDEGLTMSAGAINAMRRSASEKMSEERGRSEDRETYDFKYEFQMRDRSECHIAAEVQNAAQLSAAQAADIIYMPIGVFEKSDKKDKYIVSLPKVTYDIEYYVKRLKKAGAKRALCSTIGTAKALLEHGIEPIGDYGLNITNSVSLIEYEKQGIKHVTLSPELTARQIRAIALKGEMCEAVSYGKMMMMTTRACIIKAVRGGCRCEKPLYLKDARGAEFLVCADKCEHINKIYNSAVTFMADKKDVISSLGVRWQRLIFTDESAEEVRSIISMYKGEENIKTPKGFTRGYFMGGKK